MNDTSVNTRPKFCYLAAPIVALGLNMLWLIGADLDGVSVANNVVAVPLCLVFGLCALRASWIDGFRAAGILLSIVVVVSGIAFLISQTVPILAIAEPISRLWLVPPLSSLVGIVLGAMLAATTKHALRARAR